MSLWMALDPDSYFNYIQLYTKKRSKKLVRFIAALDWNKYRPWIICEQETYFLIPSSYWITKPKTSKKV